jgi:hypothetical protein
MGVRSTPAVAVVLCGSLAWAQPQDVQHVFQLSNSNSQKAQEIGSAVQAMLAPRALADKEGKSITLESAPANLALAQWLIGALDTPVEIQDARADRYAGATGDGSSLAIFRLANAETLQVFSEIVNAVRAIPEIREIYPVSRARAIVARADQDRLDAAEWIFRQLSGPAADAAPSRPESKSGMTGARGPQQLRVLWTRERLPPQSFQEIVNAIRTIPELTKVFPVVGKGAVALAGEADRIAVAEWLFQQLDRPTPDPSLGSPSHDGPSGDAVQVFFMSASLSEDNFRAAVNRLRATTRSPQVFPCTSARAVVVRGTPAQLSQAGELVRDAARQ